jgi:hypothetical protein
MERRQRIATLSQPYPELGFPSADVVIREPSMGEVLAARQAARMRSGGSEPDEFFVSLIMLEQATGSAAVDQLPMSDGTRLAAALNAFLGPAPSSSAAAS